MEKQQKQPEKDGLSFQTPYKKQFVSLIVSCPSKSSHACLTDNPHVSMPTAALRLYANINTNTLLNNNNKKRLLTALIHESAEFCSAHVHYNNPSEL